MIGQAWRVWRAERGILAALGIMVLVTALLAAAVPRLLQARYDAAARTAGAGTELVFSGAAPPAVQDVESGGWFRAGPADRAAVEEAAARLRERTPGPLRSLFGAEEHRLRSNRVDLDANRTVAFVWDPVAADGVRYTSGRAPVTRPGHLEFAFSEPVAAKLEVEAGDVLVLPVPGGAPLRATLAGVFAPAGGPGWRTRQEFLTAPEVGPAGYTLALGTGLVDDAGLTLLQRSALPVTYSWTFELRADRLDAATAVRVRSAFDGARGMLDLYQPQDLRLQLSSALDAGLGSYLGQLRVTRAILALALGGLAAAAAGVLLMACRLLLDRMRITLSTMRARGASLPQLAGLVAGATAPAVVIGAAGGFALGLLAEGPWTAASLWGVVLVAVLAVVVPAVGAVVAHRGTGREERPDAAGGGLSPRRLVLELLAVTVAAAGVVALRGRGLTTDAAAQGTDPFLAAVPVLLVLAAGLVVLRAYPYPLRAVGLLARRSRATVVFLGIAAASRQRVSAALPLLVLLLAVSAAAFATTVDAGLRSAQAAAAAGTVGADLSVVNHEFPHKIEETIAKVPGVERVTPARISTGKLQGPGEPIGHIVTIVIIDLDDYRRTAEGLRLDLPRAPREGEALIGADLTDAGTLELDGGSSIQVRSAGRIGGFPGVPAGQSLVLVPYTAFDAAGPFPNRMFVRGPHADPAAVREASFDNPTLTLQTYAGEHRALTRSDLVGLVHGAFAAGAVAVGGYGLLAVLLTLILSAAARGRTIAYLRTLGLSRRQARGLALAELGPLLLVATLAGWALGLVLPKVLGSGLDLSPYTGGRAVAALGPDPLATALLLGGVAAVTVLAVLADSALASRRRIDSTLRVGEQ
ncbi:FtsX-like permease family protein [Actinocorallia longicatena]|uniref:ABC3 transporter permease C-terminal domain-containing protein n=1 Tax=Actinocorallia longicatena TaxID=111803 RepID=A0ABP6QHE8_9ACTN